MTTDELRASVPADLVTASLERRTITGRVLPWGVAGNTSAGPVIFAAGTLEVPEPLHRVKLLADHRQPGHPDPETVGYATAAMDTGDALEVTFHVPETPAGDAALFSATSHLRDGLSVEVSGLAGTRDDAGTFHVSAGRLDAVATVAVPAYEPARVLTVTASNQPTEPEPEPEQEPDMPDSTDPTIAADQPDVTAAEVTPPASVPASPRRSGVLTLSGAAALIASANRGDMDPQALRAALGQSAAADFTAPDSFVNELAGLAAMGRPTIDTIRSRPLSPTGMNVTWPSWKTLPTVDNQSADFTEPASTKAEVEMLTTPVLTTAGANELSIQAVDRTDPGAVEALLVALAELYGRKTNANAVAALTTAAGQAQGLQGLSVVEAIQALLGEFSGATTPAGGLTALVAWDVYVELFVGLTDADKPAWWSGQTAPGAPSQSGGNAGGIGVVVESALPAGAILMVANQAATFHAPSAAPVQVRTVDLSVLSIDVGVYGYNATTVEWPGAAAMGSILNAPAATRTATKAK